VLTRSDRIQRVLTPEAGDTATARRNFDVEDVRPNLSYGAKLPVPKNVDSHFTPTSQSANLSHQAPYDTRQVILAEKYHPFAVDWRFLPNEALFAKDYIRHHLANISNSMAAMPKLRPMWVNTFGLGPLKAVQSAETLFIHISKTGGTSISKVLYGKNLPPYSARFWLETFGAAVRGFRSFSVLRHPVERFVSFYKMVLAGGTDIMAYSKFTRHNLKDLESIDSFINYIARQKSEGGIYSLELQKQSSFILGRNNDILVDRLFLLDRQRGFPQELSRWLSIEQIPHLNATNSNSISVSKETRAKILNIYARDLEIYEVLASRGGFADLRGVHFSER
jgi:hypothetical protein